MGKQVIIHKNNSNNFHSRLGKQVIIHKKIEEQNEKTFKKNWYDQNFKIMLNKKGDVVKEEIVTQTYFDKKSNIHLISSTYDEDYYGYRITVLDYKVNIMDTSKMQKTSPSQHLMKRSFILKTDWLTYSNGISENAYEESNNRCVYSQLEDILLRPKTGISKKRINGQKVTQESLFEYFQEIIYKYELFNKYPDFNIESGVSGELLSYLCQTIERNMYGYDANSKCFISVTEFSSKNYCPIVFYKMHEHFYLIDDATTIRSIAESNKHDAKKIISSTIIDEVDRKSVV